jgi:hypothetical protein
MPEMRLAPVGGELVRRCRRAGLSVADEAVLARGGMSRVADRWWLGTVSWRTMLSRLHASLVERGDVGLAADVEQLVGLSELEDQQAFLPVVASDFVQPPPFGSTSSCSSQKPSVSAASKLDSSTVTAIAIEQARNATHVTCN